MATSNSTRLDFEPLEQIIDAFDSFPVPDDLIPGLFYLHDILVRELESRVSQLKQQYQSGF